MIVINYYIESKKNLIDSELLDSKITDIESARMLVIKHLGKHYSDSKYKIGIFVPHDKNDNKSINITFEKSAFVKRDLLIKKLLSDND